MKLIQSTTISEERNFGKKLVTQCLEVTVDYNHEEDTFDVDSVWLFEDGVRMMEVSKLLHKSEGNPLNTIVEAIDWKEIYLDKKTKPRHNMVNVASDLADTIFGNTDKAFR